MPPRKLSAADKNAIVELYRQPGETTGTVAEQYDVSVSTISRLLKSELSSAEYDVLVRQKRAGGREAKQITETTGGTVRSRRTIKKGTAINQARTVKKGATTVKKSKSTRIPETLSSVATEELAKDFEAMTEASLPTPTPARHRRPKRAPSSESSLQLELVETTEITAVENTKGANDLSPVILAVQSGVQSVEKSAGRSVIKPVVQPKPKAILQAVPQTVSEAVAEFADEVVQGAVTEAEDLGEEFDREFEEHEVDELGEDDLGGELDDELDEDELDEDELDDDELDDELDEDELDDELDEDEPVDKPRQRQRSGPKSTRTIADEPLEILPIAEADLARMLYLIIDRTADLITCPMQEFQDLGQVPLAEESLQTLPVFDNHRVARRFSKRNQRVIKVPDGRLLAKTAPWLEAKGITRCLLDGQVYSLETTP